MQVLIQTGELYEKTISDTLLELYFNTLQDLEVEQIKKAIAGHIRDTKAGNTSRSRPTSCGRYWATTTAGR